MWRQVPWIALAAVLAIPPARHVVERMQRTDVDRTTARWKAREALITRAKVFLPDSAGPERSRRASIDFARIEPHVECAYAPKPASGTTAKFECRLPTGETVKVKYGWSSERLAEVAATRLLAALGFPADHVTLVERLTCRGCPRWPFQTRVLAEQFLLTPVVERAIDYDRSREFEWVSVERKAGGREVEVDGFEGWDWRELALVDASEGGATLGELDALRLMAVFLAHWDNKSTNHRLACAGDEAGCRVPLLMLHDLGATFGPNKVKYEGWSALPIWKDPASCVVSMETLPYEGVLFPPVQISEDGRRVLADRLKRLDEEDIVALFRGARFPDPITGDEPARDLTPWVRAFQKKVAEIADRPPCPSMS